MTGQLGREAEHPEELLSALLDGELRPDEAREVQGHAQVCASCSDELRSLGAVRGAVRALPSVEPPPGFLEALLADAPGPDDGRDDDETLAPVVPLRSRRRVSAVVGVAASVAAAIALLAPASVPGGRVAPEVAGALDAHLATVTALSGAGTLFDDAAEAVTELAPTRHVTPSTTPERVPAAAPAPYVPAEELAGGYRLVKAFEHPDGMQLLYSSGRHTLSVFEWIGRCDFEALPEGGRLLDVGGAPGWRLEREPVDGRLVVIQRGDLVALVVGDERGDAVLEAAASLPPSPALSPGDRLKRAAVSTLEHLSPAG